MLCPASPGSYTMMLFKQLLLVVLTILPSQGKKKTNLVRVPRRHGVVKREKTPQKSSSGLCPVFGHVVAGLAEQCPGRGWALACST